MVGSTFLTKHLRLYIYSFIDLEDTVKKLSKLSSQERENLKESAIAREGKTFDIVIEMGNMVELMSID